MIKKGHLKSYSSLLVVKPCSQNMTIVNRKSHIAKLVHLGDSMKTGMQKQKQKKKKNEFIQN